MTLLRSQYEKQFTRGDMQVWSLRFKICKKGVFWLHRYNKSLVTNDEEWRGRVLKAIAKELFRKVTVTLARQQVKDKQNSIEDQTHYDGGP